MTATPSGLTRAQITRTMVAVIGSTFIALVGQFMLTPWIVFQLEAQGYAASTIGWFSTATWLGLLLTTPFASQLVVLIGQRTALLLSLGVPLLTAVGIALTDTPLFWAAMMFLSGTAMAVRWIVAEACIAEIAPPERRGRLVSLYQCLLSVSFILAPVLLAWLQPANPNVPSIAALFLAAGFLLTYAVPKLSLDHHSEDQTGVRGLAQAALRNPALVIAGFLGGMFELGITGLLPVFGLDAGFEAGAAAMLIAVAGVGSMLVMIPLGEAADRFRPRPIKLVCVAVLVLGAMLAFSVVQLPPVLWMIAFAWGAAGGALYTITMITLGRTARGSMLISATSMLVLSYTAGGLIGPVLAGYALEISRQWGLGLIGVVLSVFGGWLITRYASKADEPPARAAS
ncbi:MAG: MFS transporter [Burkholderiaceae bacterium]